MKSGNANVSLERPLRTAVWVALFAMVVSADGFANKTGDSPQSPEQSTQSLLVGSWRGELDLATGGKYQWTIHRTVTGLFRLESVVNRLRGEKLRQVEAGEWRVDGEVYVTSSLVMIVDGKLVPLGSRQPQTRTYKILNMAKDAMTIRNVQTGTEFSMLRIVGGLEFTDEAIFATDAI